MKRSQLTTIVIYFLLILSVVLASCGAPTPPPTAPSPSPPPAPTPAPTPTPEPAPKPSPTPEPSPTPTPTPAKKELKVHFIDVGQGDSILIDLGETEILIDGGGKSPGVATYLSEHVDGAIETMVATHPHADHIGGLITVLGAFDVQGIWLNGDTSTSKTYQDFMSQVNAEGASIHEAQRGQMIQQGVLTFHILHPVKPLSKDTNNNSIVLLLSYGSIDFLFTGDAGKQAEAAMLTAADLPVPDVEVLKVGHHGSRTASSQDFLTIMSPELAIYMAKEGNRYGHPHQETLTALANIGAEIYGTDKHGTIIVSTDGNEYSLETEK